MVARRQPRPDPRGVHRLAAAANAAVLYILLLVAACAPALQQPVPGLQRGRAQLEQLPPPDARAHRVVLVIIDGLRRQEALDARVMPHLCQLAERGDRGTVHVESLIPSSVAALVALATGAVAAPASFVFDFQARPSTSGGLFAAVRRSGGTSFVAGPALWTDLYGPWIDASETDRTFGATDERLLDSTLDSLHSRDDRLVIVHLGEVDAAAHASGADSAAYRAAARRADDALRKIDQARDSGTLLLVTSDHGNISQGGHAGCESDVILVPLVAHGPGLPNGCPGHLSQAVLPRLVLTALGIEPQPGELASPAAPGPAALVRTIGAGFLGLVACVVLWSNLYRGGDGRRPAFLLNGAVWIVLVLFLPGLLHRPAWIGAAGCAALAALWGTVAAQGSWRQADVQRGARLGAIAFAGSLLGAARLADAALSDHAPATAAPLLAALVLALSIAGLLAARVGLQQADGSRWVSGETALVVALLLLAATLGGIGHVAAVLLAVGMGQLVSHVVFSPTRQEHPRPARAAVAGVLMLVTLAGLLRLSGESVSLSTINVRVPFAVVHWPLGLLWASLLVVALQSLVPVSLVAGSRRLFAAGGETVADCAVGIAGAAAGQALLATLVLATPAAGQQLRGLALGLLVRVLVESVLVYLSASVFLSFARSPRPSSSATAVSP